ncbi:MAG: TonB family protein [Bryobacteraceae bacterium]
MKIVPPMNPDAQPSRSDGTLYPMRQRSFVLSVCLHGLLLFLLGHGPAYLPDERPEKPVRGEEEASQKKVVYLSLKDLEIALRPNKPEATQSAAPVVHRNTVVTPPAPTPSDRLVYQPERPAPLKQDIPLPNLVAVSPKPSLPAIPAPAVPAPAPPPKAQPKAFQMPVNRTRPSDRQPLVAEDAPTLQANSAAPRSTALDKLAEVKGPPPKAFVPPPKSGAKGQAQEWAIAEVPPVEMAKSNVNAAVLGLNPAASLKAPLPPGSQQANIGQAPKAGPATRGSEGGLQAPGLEAAVNIRGKEPAAAATGPAGPKPELVSEVTYSDVGQIESRARVRSVPLLPDKIPGYVRDHFGSRHVYLFVFNRPNEVTYSGHWFLWFAERQQLPGDDPHMQAPIPFRVTDPASAKSKSDAVLRGKVRLAVIVRKSGFVDDVRLLSGLQDQLDAASMQALKRWAFQPAKRSGIAVDIDVMVEIPYDIKSQVASGR